MTQKSTPDNEIEAYAAFDDKHNMLYATIKSTRAACSEALHRFNPPVPDHHYPFKVQPILIQAAFDKQNEFEE